MRSQFIFLKGCLIILSCVALSACNKDKPLAGSEQKAIGMPNPASVHCEKVGGKLSIEKDDQGAERGICETPDGKKTDEWELYRRDNPGNATT